MTVIGGNNEFLDSACRFGIAFNYFYSGDLDASIEETELISSKSELYALAQYIKGLSSLAQAYDFIGGGLNYYYVDEAYYSYDKAASVVEIGLLQGWTVFRRGYCDYLRGIFKSRIEAEEDFQRVKEGFPGTGVGEMGAFFLPAAKAMKPKYSMSEIRTDINDFLRGYPDSVHIPRIIGLQGLAQLMREEYLNAEISFMQVIDNYPDSEYERDARFQLVLIYRETGKVAAYAENLEILLSKTEKT